MQIYGSHFALLKRHDYCTHSVAAAFSLGPRPWLTSRSPDDSASTASRVTDGEPFGLAVTITAATSSVADGPGVAEGESVGPSHFGKADGSAERRRIVLRGCSPFFCRSAVLPSLIH